MTERIARHAAWALVVLLAAGAPAIAGVVAGQQVAPGDPEKRPPDSDPAKAAPEKAEDAAEKSQDDQEDDDLGLDRVESDFTIITLPTNLRLPRHKLGFRLTHRFNRPLDEGSFGDLVADLFGFDAGAQIGLEVRFAPARRAQIGIHRTNDRTIELFGQYDVARQTGSLPLGIGALVTIEGTDNFSDEFTTAVGAILSRTIAKHVALYVEPIFVGNSNLASDPVDSNNTFLMGLGARIRVRPSVYVVGEFIPRVAGYDPGTNQGSVGVEMRAGGHIFQLNFSNAFGTTMGQIARGGPAGNDWYIGFNLSRKFY
jgi:Membrane bound beta barrel domain (DUF5777)